MKKTKPKLKKKVKPKKVKKISLKDRKTGGKLAGKVTHYFSDISVGVIKLSAPLNEGDQIRIMGGENTDFNQMAASMQVDHKPVKKAKKGNSVALYTLYPSLTFSFTFKPT